MIFFRLIIILIIKVSLLGATDILKTSEVFIDKSGKYTIDNISNAKFKAFKNYTYPYSKISKIHRGYTDETVWIKFSITNNSNKPLNKVLIIDNQMLDHITLYTQQQEEYKKEIQGVLNNRIFTENILDFYFNIKLKPKETKQYYLKVSSLSCAVYFTLKLMDKEQLYQQEIEHQLALTLFFGAMIALILYNLFIYIFTKDIAYLYYVLYILFTVWNHVSYSGVGLYILSSSKAVTADTFLAIFYMSATTIFAILFSRKFLQINKYKKVDIVLKTIITVNIVTLFFVTDDFYPLDIYVAGFMFTLLLVVIFSYYLLYKREPNVKYFVVGWTIAIIGWVMLCHRQFGYYNFMDEFEYFYELTVFLEAILFSIALSAKLNKTKELEIAVNKSKILTKELHHRVKNNMQFIISMYRLKLSKYTDKNLSSILNEIELTIQAMSATHEMLYTKSDLEKIDTKEYFGSLIKRISKSFDMENIDIETDIDTKLAIDKSITLGIILNELITNSLKYAFKDKKGTISISLHKENKNYKLIYNDNGIGFDTQKYKKSFGTRIIENLVKDDLKGTISIHSNKGVTYTLII